MANHISVVIFIFFNFLLQNTIQQEGVIGNQFERQSCDCGVANRRTRIVNGVTTETGEYPWMCEIYRAAYDTSGKLLAKEPSCGGALVTPRNVITAAHCVDGVDAGVLLVDLGDQTLSISTEAANVFVKVSGIKTAGYDSQTHANDIAILTLAQPVTYTTNIRPICLPPKNLDLTGQKLVVTGWGTIYQSGPTSDDLKEVTLPVIPLSDCKQKFKNTTAIIDERVVCTEYQGSVKQDACQGDSGGPAAWQCGGRFILGGVVSLSIGCALYPGVYTDVSHYRDWIIANTDNYTLCGYDCYPQPTPSYKLCGLPNSDKKRSDSRDKRIYAGDVTAPNQYPWMVAIYVVQSGSLVFVGGATLISDQWIITAAKLVFELTASNVYAVVGDYDNSIPNQPGEKIIQASQIVIYPSFDKTLMTNNLALIKLSTKVVFDLYISPICLPDPSMITRDFSDGTKFTFLGWGLTNKGGSYVYADKLRKVTLTSISDSSCKSYYGNSVVQSTTTCTQSSLATAICDGDKGGPLMMSDSEGYYYLTAIQSFRSSDSYCTTSSPAGNQEVVPYMNWITQTTGVQPVTGPTPLI